MGISQRPNLLSPPFTDAGGRWMWLGRRRSGVKRIEAEATTTGEHVRHVWSRGVSINPRFAAPRRVVPLRFCPEADFSPRGRRVTDESAACRIAGHSAHLDRAQRAGIAMSASRGERRL